MDECYAHSVEGRPPSEWQELKQHLEGTAKLSAKFASAFGSEQWGYLAGLWHDLGKYSPAFQQYIYASGDFDAHIEDSKPGRVDHSTAGALLAVRDFKEIGTILAYLVAGHHAGLADYESDVSGKSSLSQRLTQHGLLSDVLQAGMPPEIIDQAIPKDGPSPGADPAFWVRLLFSCVVDADFLDTEAFLSPGKASIRAKYRELSELLPSFTEYMRKMTYGSKRTKVNNIRNEILAQCVESAAQPPGKYTLTVPTGGGKTLASMGFALHHAVKYNMKRIIYVIPYTSIIEQTAAQFRDIFGDEIIEHHSNLDIADYTKETARSRLACENWDAPIIVTTSVQFFESLFASRPSRCRKLHNIVNSIVVLDEVQLLPPEFLNPILKMLNELQEHYGVTLLLSTATQPAFAPHKTLDFDFKGLPDMKEIIENSLELYAQLNRVSIKVPQNLDEPQTWDSLAVDLIKQESVLCIVNRRDDCRKLWAKMPAGTYHLSALMCGAHRSEKIAEIKDRLKKHIPTRVISTQLVEAGVDLDFPVVYRALAGLDSIAQAAGRCNREGILPEKGEVVIFVPPSETPIGVLRQAAQIGKSLLQQDHDDILAPNHFEAFFKELYWLQGDRLDKYGILSDLQMSHDFHCSFRTAAKKFQLIDESYYAPVVVQYGEGKQLIKQLYRTKPDRELYRKLQRYIVNIPRYLHNNMLVNNIICEIHPGLFIQNLPSFYNDQLGLLIEKANGNSIDDLMI